MPAIVARWKKYHLSGVAIWRVLCDNRKGVPTQRQASSKSSRTDARVFKHSRSVATLRVWRRSHRTWKFQGRGSLKIRNARRPVVQQFAWPCDARDGDLDGEAYLHCRLYSAGGRHHAILHVASHRPRSTGGVVAVLSDSCSYDARYQPDLEFAIGKIRIEFQPLTADLQQSASLTTLSVHWKLKSITATSPSEFHSKETLPQGLSSVAYCVLRVRTSDGIIVEVSNAHFSSFLAGTASIRCGLA
jgi:hypothetical protein